MTTKPVQAWRLYVWDRGRFVLRSTHYSADDAKRAVAQVERGVRYRVRPAVIRVADWRHPHPPTAAQRHREQQADRMVVRRQALGYIKSGSNGTEIPSIPAEAR